MKKILTDTELLLELKNNILVILVKELVEQKGFTFYPTSN
jgi:hypothetical protein